MPRSLIALLLGSIALALLYLVVHVREPLRLNLGDAWADADVLAAVTGDPSGGNPPAAADDLRTVGPPTATGYRYVVGRPLVVLVGRALGRLGIDGLGALRLVGLAWSGLGLLLWFAYLRRLFTARTALIATALIATSLLWILYADSLHEAPLAQLGGFLALWGVVRAIETGWWRHRAAVVVGGCTCWLASTDFVIVLPIAALATIYLKAGNPFARGNRRLVATFALGCALAVVGNGLWVGYVVGWHELAAELGAALAPSAGTFAVGPTVIRRLTLVFTPLIWITCAVHALRAIRAPDLGAAIRGTTAWLLVGGLASLALPGSLAGARMLGAQALLPFYALGTARLLEELLDAAAPLRRGAIAWLVAAPLWSAYVLVTQPRSVLAPADVARTSAYLAASDHNDFVLSNLLADGPLWAAFRRHAVAALDDHDVADVAAAPRNMLAIFDRSGADVVHAIVFTDPGSRSIDRSMWQLAARRRTWSVTGWPQVNHRKVAEVVRDYDDRVRKNLMALDATRVLVLGNFAIYRVERAAVVERLAGWVTATPRIDFASIEAQHHELSGWGDASAPASPQGGPPASEIIGMRRCRSTRCATLRTRRRLDVPDAPLAPAAQLVIRVDSPCDQRLTIALGRPGTAQVSVAGFASGPLAGSELTTRVPARALAPGLNTVTIESLTPAPPGPRLRVVAIEVAPICAP
jgi:hypothetical protein